MAGSIRQLDRGEIMASQPLFSAIVHTYNRPNLLRVAVDALRKQTHSNIEIIVVNNGGTPETADTIEEIKSEDSRVRSVTFTENQYHPNDPMLIVSVCYNAGLDEAKGEYVWVQEDDDFLAPDYVEKMLALFKGNPDCTTAAGLPVIIEIDGNITPDQPEGTNLRGRYTPGREVALDYLSGSRKLFGAPGTIFMMKRETLVEAGGYHKAIESSHLYGIVPFGTTGFDASALVYWRNHPGQVSKQLTANGNISLNESLSLIKDWQLEQKWSVFGADDARQMVRIYKRGIYDNAASWVVILTLRLSLISALKIIRKSWLSGYFWTRVLTHGLNRKHYAGALSPVIKPVVKLLFRTLPGLAKLTPGLSKKADRWT